MPRTYDDWPTAASGLPIRTLGATPPPFRPSEPAHVPGQTAPRVTVDRLRVFADTVLDLHHLTSGTDGFIPMCTCGSPARYCPIVRVEHEVLGVPMPFTFDPPRPPHYEV